MGSLSSTQPTTPSSTPAYPPYLGKAGVKISNFYLFHIKRPSGCLEPVLWIGIVFMPIRIRFFLVDADPDLDPDWHRDDADPHGDPTPSFILVRK